MRVNQKKWGEGRLSSSYLDSDSGMLYIHASSSALVPSSVFK